MIRYKSSFLHLTFGLNGVISSGLMLSLSRTGVYPGVESDLGVIIPGVTPPLEPAGVLEINGL